MEDFDNLVLDMKESRKHMQGDELKAFDGKLGSCHLQCFRNLIYYCIFVLCRRELGSNGQHQLLRGFQPKRHRVCKAQWPLAFFE
jgi:hypothetical protein